MHLCLLQLKDAVCTPKGLMQYSGCADCMSLEQSGLQSSIIDAADVSNKERS